MNEQQSSNGAVNLEELWQFSGQGLRSGEFNTAMVHLYRGEVTRSNTWRSRLDVTTNWAVITTGAALTFTFGTVDHTHLVLIMDTLLVLLFLFMEARRYRYYELWSYRVRLMEKNFYGGLLSPPFLPSAEWASQVADSLKRPRFPISLGEAFGRRYRRNYFFIFTILAVGWIIKVAIHPAGVTNFSEFVAQAATGLVPGWLMLLAGFLFHGSLIAIGLFTINLRSSHGEVFAPLPSHSWVKRLGQRFRRAYSEMLEIDVPELPHWLRREESQQLVYVITDQDEAVGHAVMESLGRGVTKLSGTGMYTSAEHPVLLCVINQNQANSLEEIVKHVDPKAFVIVTDVKNTLGNGFRPLEAA